MAKLFKGLWILFYSSVIAAGQPSINGIFNAASWAPSGMANGDIAQGSIFIVTGSGIGPATLQQGASYPLPTTQGIGGTSIQVTVGSQGFDCIMIYSSSSQVAAILPSRTALGAGTLALLYHGSRTVFPIKVVQSSFAMFAVNQRGSGPGVITDLSYHYIAPTNSAHAGDLLVGWGTGLGGTTGDETMPPPQVDLKSGVQVFVGNQPATVSYGGRGSSPGLDQINFIVPASVTGCYVSVAVVVRGVIGNFTTLSIAPPGQSVCSDSVGGFAASDLVKFQSTGSLRTAAISLQSLPGGQSQVSAAVQNLNFASLISERGLTGWPSPGNCIVLELLTGGSANIGDPVLGPGLDAGGMLTVTGGTLAGQASAALLSKGFYWAQLGSTIIGPGAYTIANGPGGADVGSFMANLTVPPMFNWTNMGAAGVAFVPRGQDLLIAWSGAGSSDAVAILGITSIPSSTALVPMFEFLCMERASAGQFSVPSLVLTSIPNTAQVQGMLGMTLAVSDVSFSSFAAPGLDQGLVASFNFLSRISALQ